MTYSSEVLADSPLAYYRLGEASGTTMADSSGNARDGSYVGAPTLGVSGLLVGDSDTAMQPASGKRGEVASAAWMDTTSVTLECLVKLAAGQTNKGILTRFGTGAGGSGQDWLLWMNTSGKIAIRFYNSAGSSVDLAWSTTPTVDVAYHVAASYESGQARLYINGTEVASSTALTGDARTLACPIQIGTYQTSTSFWFNGVIDEVAQYGTALSGARIAAHYGAGNIHVRDHAGGQTKTTGTTLAVALSANVASGNTLVIHAAVDNISGTTSPDVSSIDVPSGETATWSRLGGHDAAGSGGAASVLGELWAITTTQEWSSSFTPTITWDGSRNGKAAAVAEFFGVTTTIRGSAAVGTDTSGTPTATVTSPETGDLVIGGSSWETASAPTGDSDTTNGSWSAVNAVGTSGALDPSNVVAALQYKIVTGTGSQTYNPTGTSSDCGVVVVALQPGSVTTITPADSTHGHGTDSPALTQVHAAAPVDSVHAHATEAPSLTQVHELAPDAADHSHATDSPALTQAHALSPVDSDHTHAVESPALTQVHEATPADSAHGHAAESPALTQTHELAPDDTAHSHAADASTVSFDAGLTPADSVHSHASESPAVTQVHALTPADAAHGHVTDAPALTQVHELTPAESAHTHTSDATTVDAIPTLAPANTAHSHAAESPALTQVHALLPIDTTHAHAADLAELSQAHALIALDSLHTHISDNTTFSIGLIVTPAGRTSTAAASPRTSTALAESRTSTATASSRTSN